MDSDVACTRNPTLPPIPPPPNNNPSKLPVKRKTQSQPQSPSPSPNQFKFHRVWTEPDELLFLRSLIATSSSLRLSFPRDLPVFYSHFLSSPSLSHPYSKSQLYEKLRRLRNKFRSLSSRLDRGLLDPASLSPHDSALFDLSRRLWSPQYASSSPFFSSSSSSATSCIDNDDHFDGNDDNGNEDDDVDDGRASERDGEEDGNGDFDLKEVSVGYDFGEERDATPLKGNGNNSDDSYHNSDDRDNRDCSIGELVGKTVTDALDRSLKEVRVVVERNCDSAFDSETGCAGCSGGSSSKKTKEDLSRRWNEQTLAELDVFGQRLKLLLEDSLTQK